MNLKYLKPIERVIAAIILVTLVTGFSAAYPAYAAPGDVTRVSVDSAGAQANGSSRHEQISGDGRFVVFESDATNLAGGTGGLFLKDRQTGAITRVGVDGEAASISSDGRFIAFDSAASTEVSGDTNGFSDVFVFDRQTSVTTRVSVDSSGAQTNGNSTDAAISRDGRYVAFISDATNLVGGDTNAVGDIFLRDRQANTTERISIASDGAQANAASFDISISADGRVVIFTSGATNLVSGDTNGRPDTFARDRQTNTTTQVSVNSSGIPANLGVSNASTSSVSADGRYVTFSSSSSNLKSPEPLSNEALYIRDRQTGTTTLASTDSNGFEMIGWAEEGVISADGHYVAFEFDDKGDGLPFLSVYVRDLQTGATISAPGAHNVSSFEPSLSADGHYLAFWTPASNLVAGDTNGTNDIFVYEVSFVPDLAPTVNSVQPLCGGGVCSPSAPIISFQVTFSEVVTGVTTDDFALTSTGGISGASVTDVSGSGNTFIVNVNGGTGDGTLRLDVIDNDSIRDATLHPLGGTGAGNGNFSSGGVYTIDKTSPQTTLSLRADPDYSSAAIVHFNVTFSEFVTGVDVSDFGLTPIGGIIGASIMDASGSGNTYTVTVNTGTGDGGLRLDIIDNDTITDAAGNQLGGAGAGNGNFTAGEAYTIDKNPPVVISSLRLDANPTAATVVHFAVTFSEPVNGLDLSDFMLTTTGSVSGASMTEISRSANVYTITVATGNGNGTLRLDVIDNDSIIDIANHPLGGVGAGNGNFTTGDTYTINKIVITPVSTDFRSTGANDGWVLESKENSNVGGSKNSAAAVFKLGDDAQDRQFRSILHFPTYYLPDNAVITQVILMIKKQDVVGTDPFNTHQNIVIDIRRGYFSNFNIFSYKSLQLTDFQASADAYSVGTIQNNPVSGWFWSTLDSRAFPYINLTDITQIRLGFQLDDNDDMGEDYIRFYSGDAPDQKDRPHLLIQYYVPK